MKDSITKYLELVFFRNGALNGSYCSKNFNRLFFMSGCVILMVACGDGRTETATIERRAYEERINEVDVAILERSVFYKQIVSNGKLKSYRKSHLRFKVPGELKELSGKNGSSVEKGEAIAVLDQFEYRQRLEVAQTNLKRTSIELEDALLAYGGSIARDRIPKAIYESAAIRSGYVSALNELKTAQFNLEQTILRAPFAGKIANLKPHEYEMVNTADAFCTLIDDSAFEVEFHLIESEITEVALNDKVKVVPFSTNELFNGKVSEINPLIDENGLVLVKAMVRNRGGLWEGMNVKVVIEKEDPNHLVVPKSAVVLRQNQEVLFKYVNGVAFWTYVETELENSSSYSVIPHPHKGGDLNAGDTIIISNNINLAHESEVKIRNEMSRSSTFSSPP